MSDHRPGRRSIRLRGHDYARGGEYSVTICTRDRGLFFEDARLRGLAREVWEGLPDRFPDHVRLDAFVVMPNHVHGIIVIVPPAERTIATPDGETVRAYGGDGMGAMNDASMKRSVKRRDRSRPAVGCGRCLCLFRSP